MRTLVVANAGDDDAGYVGEQLQRRGATLDVRHRDDPTTCPTSPGDADLVVLLGSEWSTYWPTVQEQVAAESQLVREAAAADVPVLGICYGAQLLAHALGGCVERASSSEIGWFRITSHDERLAPSGPWFEWHVDTFRPPPGADVLATSPVGPQAYRLGRVLAWQFHPEVTPQIIRRWGDGVRDQAEGVGVDLAAMERQTAEHSAEAATRCRALVDAFLDDVAKPW